MIDAETRILRAGVTCRAREENADAAHQLAVFIEGSAARQSADTARLGRGIKANCLIVSNTRSRKPLACRHESGIDAVWLWAGHAVAVGQLNLEEVNKRR